MDEKTEQWGVAVSATSPIGSLGSEREARPLTSIVTLFHSSCSPPFGPPPYRRVPRPSSQQRQREVKVVSVGSPHGRVG